MNTIKIEKTTTGPGGRGFEQVTHTAHLDGVVIGEWRRGSISNWAGFKRGMLMMRYDDWKAELLRHLREGT